MSKNSFKSETTLASIEKAAVERLAELKEEVTDDSAACSRRGRPLLSYQTIVQLIAATTTKAGLIVRSELDANAYPKGIKVADADMDALNIERHTLHGEWNYTVKPQTNMTQ